MKTVALAFTVALLAFALLGGFVGQRSLRDGFAAPIDRNQQRPTPQKKFVPGSMFRRLDPMIAWEGETSPGGLTEATIVRGLKWLVRQQRADGSWILKDELPNQFSTAGTAMALLPFLAVNKTQVAGKSNAYDVSVKNGLQFLINTQDKNSGSFGGILYEHALGTLAICEALGLSQDEKLKAPAQRAVNYIVQAQHRAGGWRYGPGQQGDVSVTGWQVLALKTAEMAGLTVSAEVFHKALDFIRSCEDQETHGYGYTDSKSPTPNMTAESLLCRMYLENPTKRAPLAKAIERFILPNPPGIKNDVYFQFFATQVLFHQGGADWSVWKGKLRDDLTRSQNGDPESPERGSWSPQGLPHCQGRLMATSLNLLNLEIYYRYWPMFLEEKDLKLIRLGSF